MFFEDYCEFIEALYCVHYCNITENKKINYYKNIYNDYLKFGKRNKDFEEIYNDITSGVVCTLNYSDLEFLKKYNGLLFSISDLLDLKIKIHYLDSCPHVKKLLGVENRKKQHHCIRCGNTNQNLFYSYKNEDVKIVYCMRCLEFGRVDNFAPMFKINIPVINKKNIIKPSTKLSDLQSEASKQLVINTRNNKNTLVWAVCGAGKTEIVYELIYDSVMSNKRICMAIPRKDVVKELYTRFSKDFRGLDINVLHGDEKSFVDSNFYITTTHQLIKYYGYFDIVIIDEVDAFPYSGDECLEEGALSSLVEEGVLVFLSATPSKKIKSYVDDIIKIPIRYHGYLLPVPRIRKVNKKLLIFEEKSEIMNKYISEILNKKRRLLVFVPVIAMCQSLKNYLEKYISESIKIDYVYSEDKDRSEKIQRFYNFKIDILITTTILERGVTFDYLDVIVFDAGHKNFTKESLIQIAGRVGRKEYDNMGEIIYFSDEITKNIKHAIKEIEYMNNLASYRKLNKE